jgi:uroporphyrinogen decarboxylase
MFIPDYKNILNAVQRLPHKRIPLYEHIIDTSIMEEILGIRFAHLYNGNEKDKRQYFKNYIRFFKKMGYDTVSFECLITSIMPGSGCLYYKKPSFIKNRDDFKSYPWKDIPELFFNKYEEDFKILSEEILPGMKAIGGPGNGILECVQDIVGLENLCLISINDPDLFKDLLSQTGSVLLEIWRTFLRKFSDTYVICRFGDDLGYKTSTILNPEEDFLKGSFE